MSRDAGRVAEILASAAIDAVCPRRKTREALARIGLDRASLLVAFGKASRGMTEGALDFATVDRGIVVATDDAPLGASIVVRRGAHPMPARDAAAHGEEVLALARSLREDDVALVLLSGGGSSLLEAPIDGVSIEEIAATSQALMSAGADIAELNAVRRCLSRLKGGGLGRALAPARIVVVVISDVPGRSISLVASGPCAGTEGWPDPSDVIARRGVVVPASVRAAIASARELAAPARVETLVAASNEDAVVGMRDAAASIGIPLTIASDAIVGDAYEEGPAFAGRAGAGLVGGGETTVRVRGRGRGGRNQAAALAVAAGDSLAEGAAFVALATDGVDGSSDAAGAWVDAAVIDRARALGLDPVAAMQEDDSHAFFAGTGSRIVTGPTGTNVADVWCCYRP